MTQEALTARLFALQDIKYQAFQAKLIPNIDPETIIGVRTPELRKLAKEMGEGEDFLQSLPHRYFEENQLHGFILANGKDFETAIAGVETFLPYVDNWATCDQLSPKAFKKHRAEPLPHIRRWLASGHVYTIRFGIGMLMSHFLDEDFAPEYPAMVAAVRHEDYYVRMMQAWYFATALAKQYDAVLPYITERRLEKWTHNKAIQKSVESYRITPEQKDFLKQFRIK